MSKMSPDDKITKLTEPICDAKSPPNAVTKNSDAKSDGRLGGRLGVRDDGTGDAEITGGEEPTLMPETENEDGDGMRTGSENIKRQVNEVEEEGRNKEASRETETK